MMNETVNEKEARIFNFYKKDLEKLGKEHGQIRMICIEYACSFPKINPFKMAKTLKDEGYNILFDDSSISIAENEKKRRKVEKIA
ncbi:hypothetical protein [uncultured Eubacterium sp.]|uniref:hypothetical protein n=1 Tax=uncultured Eubacterium sp. TaxID=165185 RepID=UPI0015ADD5F4|nr:hypothetical protein [uncultured Eubacterium sp.]